jgi:hypothetical protein
MKTLALILVLLTNVPFLLMSGRAAAETEFEIASRIVAGIVALALAATIGLLLLAWLRSLPTNGSRVMGILCLGVPALWLVGSLDRGIVSGQEWAFLIVVCVVTGGTWHVFKLLRASA